MKKRSLQSFFVIACMLLGVTAGCGKDENKVAEKMETVESADESVPLDEVTDGTILFEKISDREFWFGSGAGAWCTVLRVDKDGNFQGNYHDSNMGDTGEEYPNGTCYWSDFSGKFAIPEKRNDYTWATTIESIEVANEPDTEAIIDGIKYVYSQPYGLDNAGEILFYEPGAPVEKLPESYLNWMTIYDEFEDGKLPFYGIYNVNAEEGFSSYEIDEKNVIPEDPEADQEVTPDVESEVESEVKPEGIDAELEALKQQADELKNRLKTDETLSQSEMNEISAKLYKLWDDKLNELWGRLKKHLDEDAMSALTVEEREWIADKEAAVQAARDQYAGGSMEEMSGNMKGAEMTEDRVYVLAEYLK